MDTGNSVSFRQACVVTEKGLILRCVGATALGCELVVDYVKGEGLRIEVLADPIAEFLMPFMVGVVESIEKVIEPKDAAAVLGRTGELASLYPPCSIYPLLFKLWRLRNTKTRASA
jgi:hypothetical protein